MPLDGDGDGDGDEQGEAAETDEPGERVSARRVRIFVVLTSFVCGSSRRIRSYYDLTCQSGEKKYRYRRAARQSRCAGAGRQWAVNAQRRQAAQHFVVKVKWV